MSYGPNNEYISPYDIRPEDIPVWANEPEDPTVADKLYYGGARFLAGDFDWQKTPVVQKSWSATKHTLSKLGFLAGAIAHEAADRVVFPAIKYNPITPVVNKIIVDSIVEGDADTGLRTPAHDFVDKYGEKQHLDGVPLSLPWHKFLPLVLGSSILGMAENIIAKPLDSKYYGDNFSTGRFNSATDVVASSYDDLWDSLTYDVEKEHSKAYKFGKIAAYTGAFLGDMAALNRYSPKFFARTPKGEAAQKVLDTFAREPSLYQEALAGERALLQIPLPFSDPLTVTAPGFFKPFSNLGRAINTYKTARWFADPGNRMWTQFFATGNSINSRLTNTDLAARVLRRTSIPVKVLGKMSSYADRLFSRHPKMLEIAATLSESGLDPMMVMKDGKTVLEHVLKGSLKAPNASSLKHILSSIPTGANPSDRSAKLLGSWLKALSPYLEGRHKFSGLIPTLGLASEVSVPANYLPYIGTRYLSSHSLFYDTGKLYKGFRTAHDAFVSGFLTPVTTGRNGVSQQFQTLSSGERLGLPYVKGYFRGLADFWGARYPNTLGKLLLSKNPSIEQTLSHYMGGNNGFYMQFPSLLPDSTENLASKMLKIWPRANARVSEGLEKAVRSGFWRQLLANGYDPLPAMYKTFRTYINYSGLDPAQRFLRFVYPYVNFAIGNAKNSLNYLVNNPFAVIAPHLFQQDAVTYHKDVWPEYHLPDQAYQTPWALYAPIWKNWGIDVSSIWPSASLLGFIPGETPSRIFSQFRTLGDILLDWKTDDAFKPQKEAYYKQKEGPLLGLDIFNHLYSDPATALRLSDLVTKTLRKLAPVYGWVHDASYAAASGRNNAVYGTKHRALINEFLRLFGIRSFPDAATYAFVKQQDTLNRLKDPDLALSFSERVKNRLFNTITKGFYYPIRMAQLEEFSKRLSAVAPAEFKPPSAKDKYYDVNRLANRPVYFPASTVRVPGALRVVNEPLIHTPTTNNFWYTSAVSPEYRHLFVTKSDGEPFDANDYGTFWHHAAEGNINALRYASPEARNIIRDVRAAVGANAWLTGFNQFTEPRLTLHYDGRPVISGNADLVAFGGITPSGSRYCKLYDFKFGSNEVEPPADNGQLISYSLALFEANPELEWIDASVVQPVPEFKTRRPDYKDVRTTRFTRDNIAEYERKVSLKHKYETIKKYPESLSLLRELYDDMSLNPLPIYNESF